MISANPILRLIRKLRSPDNKVVVQAVEKLRANGWLEDGELEGVCLKGAHLQGADLCNANLRKTNLHMTHLQFANLSKAHLTGSYLSRADFYGADLSEADLQGATLIKSNLQSARNLTDKQLSQARSLWGTTMPDGSVYDGRFSLEGDLFAARLRHIDTNDPIAMDDYYADGEDFRIVSVEDPNRSLSSCSAMELIRKLRSTDNNVVIRAVEEMRARGHLNDGSLKWIYLRFVKMQGADLHGADLRSADLNMAHLQRANLNAANLQSTKLNKANLRGAVLFEAKLEGASLTNAILQGTQGLTDRQLAQSSSLRGAMMPDGSRYDGRFNLAGDLADARLWRVDIKDPIAMAEFYCVSVEEYKLCQVVKKIGTEPEASESAKPRRKKDNKSLPMYGKRVDG